MEKKISALKHVPYDNFEVYHPDGTLMFFCSQRKLNWYLKRDLGVMLDDKRLQLTFIPGGYGDPLTILDGRTNICVIDGSTENLTKHHAVPSQYRKHFELKYKDKNSCDIVVLNRENHDKYELEADVFKEQLVQDYINSEDIELKHVWYTAKAYHNTLSKHYDKLPATKQIYLTLKLEGLLDNYDFDVKEFDKSNSPYNDLHNKMIVNKIGIERLIILWKLHFIKHAQPKFLPDWWTPNTIKILEKKLQKNEPKSQLKIYDMFQDSELVELIKKYNLYETACLYK